MDAQDLLDDFLAESQELLFELEEQADELRIQHRPVDLFKIFRILHTIKGNVGFITTSLCPGRVAFEQAVHQAESYVELCQKRSRSPDQDTLFAIIDLIGAALDTRLDPPHRVLTRATTLLEQATLAIQQPPPTTTAPVPGPPVGKETETQAVTQAIRHLNRAVTVISDSQFHYGQIRKLGVLLADACMHLQAPYQEELIHFRHTTLDRMTLATDSGQLRRLAEFTDSFLCFYVRRLQRWLATGESAPSQSVQRLYMTPHSLPLIQSPN